MKKKLTYRDKLLELARIYNIKEIQDYIRNRKNLTSGQIELILRKNKIIIPSDFKTSFIKENFTKPINKFTRKIDNLKEDTSKTASRFSRKVGYFKEDSSRKVGGFFYNLWKSVGRIGINFLNILPDVGKVIYNWFGNILTDLFNSIYNQKISTSGANKAIVGFFVITGIIVLIFSGFKTFQNKTQFLENENVVQKKEENVKKPELKPKQEVKKPEIKQKQKAPKKSKEKVAELILPDLNLKTKTVLNLFEDVNYDLNTVRFEKRVKPIYFTQFPKDLDEIQSVQLKKETFIKIVLPLIVAENEKILDDRFKLKQITSRKITSDVEKQWLRQKFLEYKVKKGSINELNSRMDIIPASIALAQAAKESGWGTSRFALEGNAIFGQWTWSGSGIAPLLRDKSKNHKILRFPILRASVKAYKNNLNTHKSYVKFREKRQRLREKNKKIRGLDLTDTLGNYAETGKDYIKTLEKIIVQNRLMDFEPVRLTNSVEKKELNL